jgi:hypothetical protein
MVGNLPLLVSNHHRDPVMLGHKNMLYQKIAKISGFGINTGILYTGSRINHMRGHAYRNNFIIDSGRHEAG